MKNEKWGNLDNDGRHTKKISAASFSDKNKTKQEKQTSVTRIRPKSLLGYFSKPNEIFFSPESLKRTTLGDFFISKSITYIKCNFLSANKSKIESLNVTESILMLHAAFEPKIIENTSKFCNKFTAKIFGAAF